MADPKEIVSNLKKKFSLSAAGFITRDGMPVYIEVPEGAYGETFSIMCATILGAASTAATELGEPNPEYLAAETEKLKIFIVSGGMKGLLVAAGSKEINERDVIDSMKSAMKEL